MDKDRRDMNGLDMVSQVRLNDERMAGRMTSVKQKKKREKQTKGAGRGRIERQTIPFFSFPFIILNFRRRGE